MKDDHAAASLFLPGSHAPGLTWLEEAAEPWSSAPGSVLITLGPSRGRPWRVAGGKAEEQEWSKTSEVSLYLTHA